MPTMRDIKTRIRSVTTTRKTTKAMNLVASSKLQRAKQKLSRNNPYFEQMERIIGGVIKNCENLRHKYFEGFEERVSRRFLVLVASNDRGLCGGYNSNACKKALAVARELQADYKAKRMAELGSEWDEARWNREKSDIVQIYALGKKARDYFRPHERDFRLFSWRPRIAENPDYQDARDILAELLLHYDISDETKAPDIPLDEIHIVYTHFHSVITHTPEARRILPLAQADFLPEGEEAEAGFLKLEPGRDEVLDYAVPKYIENIIYYALSNASAAGQGATMTAMDAATENADGLISDLQLMFNRARQGAITQEIAEIVGGANALG
ncbi:MAG: F0F1 ATP synthase subunit gamma [Defluviitaleaceae bacterium]|nr:F0F1 ATP synthase subunit gamma [Defluviitaleaceae bacterium]